MAEKFEVYAEVTNSIIAALESGTAPWRKPWTGTAAAVSFPRRANGQPYQGINVIMLWLVAAQKGYSSPFWMTFNQAKEYGANVRKGEKASTVVKVSHSEKGDEETGEKATRRFTKAYRVFNADQIDNLPEEYRGSQVEQAQDLGTTASPALDDFFARTGAWIRTSEDPRAFYDPQADNIHMPPVSTFTSAAGYYSSLAHEMSHWTGHSSRLDRFKKGRDRAAYALEELVAEIGNCMVCASIGIVPDFDQSAAYIEGWLRALKDDKRLIFTAASEAQKACNFIMQQASEERKLAA